MNKDLELYTDYLISRFGPATATGLSAMLNGDVSHDHITRFLSQRTFTSKDLWLQVKPTVRDIEHDDGVLIFDDTVQEKAFTDENAIMCWHYDPSAGRHVRGLNILNALYHCQDVSIPVAFEIIRKPIQYCDLKTRQVKRTGEASKNELMRDMMATCLQNALKFKYVLMDCWFTSVENFDFIRDKKKHFIAALKDNRLVALSKADKQQGQYTRIDTLAMPEQHAVKGWLKGYSHARQVFTNQDGSTGWLDLVCSDLALDWRQITTTYKKRWAVEVFHKSMKSNAGLAKSPTRTVMTQSNHVFMSIYAVFKLECLKLKSAANHFAIRAKLLISATRQAYEELQKLRAAA
jgi:hypothetical protein